MRYRRLTPEQRYQIEGYLKTEMSVREIARALDVAPSTISRELRRNCANYCAQKAQKEFLKRRLTVGPSRKIVGRLKAKVDELLGDHVSLDYIHQKLQVSTETVYQYVYRDQRSGGELYKHLRRARKWRRSRQKLRNQKQCSSREDRISIEHRPTIVEKRRRIGDYERDLMLGKNGRILTVVDRVSRLTKIARVEKHLSVSTHEQTVRLLKGSTVRTITNDHGHEFSLHEFTGAELDAQIFFSDPGCPWQRGTNENTNGLIRQYLRRGTDFNQISDEYLQWIEDRLNNRPRKILGYRTPLEVHRKLSRVLH